MQAKLRGKARKGFEIPINRLIKQKSLTVQEKRAKTRKGTLFAENADNRDKIAKNCILKDRRLKAIEKKENRGFKAVFKKKRGKQVKRLQTGAKERKTDEKTRKRLETGRNEPKLFKQAQIRVRSRKNNVLREITDRKLKQGKILDK